MTANRMVEFSKSRWAAMTSRPKRWERRSTLGLNTWAAFYGSDGNAEIAGDVAMLSHEMTQVLKALRTNGLSVVAIHHRMTTTEPAIYFLRYWGRAQQRSWPLDLR